MRRSPFALRHACALLSTALVAALLVLAGGAAPTRDLAPAAGSTYLCFGYAGCRSEGYSDAGYGSVNDRMYWNMYPGHNCTNYVAYRMIRAGMSPNRPFGYPGNATNWGQHMSDRVDGQPRVGAVAWWRAYDNGSGSAGHVAYVERVEDGGQTIVISEDSWGGTFSWRRITKSSGRWPTGFIHLIDRTIDSSERPRLIGAAKLGERVRTTDGKWSIDDPRIRYRWFAGRERIWGERGPSITVGPDQVGARIRAKVIVTKEGWERAWRRTAPSQPAQPGDIAVAEGPTVTGTPIRGETLSVEGGGFAPEPDSVDVQWLADGQPIAGATSGRLRLTPDHVGTRISVRLTAHKAAHADQSVTSEPTDVVREGRVEVTSEPTIRGRTKVNKVLTVVPGEVEPAQGTEATHQWLRDGEPIPGATGQRYRLGPADFGTSVGVRVTYTHPQRYPAETVVTKSRIIRAGTQMDVRTRIRGKRGDRAVFIVDVKPWPPRVDAVFAGDITVWFDGRKRRVSVDDGHIRIPFRGSSYGTQRAVIRQHANAHYLGSRHRIRVTVPRP